MKQTKIFKGLIVASMLMFSANIWAYDFEVDGIYYNAEKKTVSVTHGDNAAGSYSGDVTIPETVTYDGKEYEVTAIGPSAFYSCSELHNIYLPNTILTIEDSAFAWCTNLVNVVIPEGVTSIGSYAFQDCTSLFTVTTYEGLLSIGDGAFAGCCDLANITLPTSISTMGQGVFAGCTSLPGGINVEP